MQRIGIYPDSGFQSTLPHGERPEGAVVIDYGITFQSTLPHGERPAYSTLAWVFPPHFNPRSRTGSDSGFPASPPALHMISIHAPARGATAYAAGLLQIKEEFQSTLPHGERPEQALSDDAPHNFNPRSRTGSDQKHNKQPVLPIQFQSTLPHGERH